MTISPSDFLFSAKELSPSQSETANRNAASRAYYAAFHHVKSIYKPDRDFARQSRTGMHQTYIDQLMQAKPNSLERLTAVKLSSLKGRRVRADYDIDVDFPGHYAALAIKNAEDIFSTLEQLPPASEPTPPDTNTASPANQPQVAPRPKLQRIV